ncbi:hypothetical protein [Bacteroides fragilis]|uniref:hypothetical protein n=1 Tax=Bacteroides fragilis TaxID=817 RepID=UPI0032EE4036
MDSIERKKPNPYHINEKEILDIVAAKGSYLSCISGDPGRGGTPQGIFIPAGE